MNRTLLAVTALALAAPLHAQSFFPLRPDDPRAVDFTREAFGAHADGEGAQAEIPVAESGGRQRIRDEHHAVAELVREQRRAAGVERLFEFGFQFDGEGHHTLPRIIKW